MARFSAWDDIPIRWKGALLIFIPAVILVVAGLIFAWQYRELRIDQEKVAHSRRVLLQAKEVMLGLVQAQSDLWALAINPSQETRGTATGNDILPLEDKYADLKKLVADNPEQIQRLEEIDPKIRAAIGLMRLYEQKIDAGQKDEVIEDLRSLPIYSKTIEIREALKSFFDEEDRLAASRSDHLVKSSFRLLEGLVASVAFGLIVSVFLGRGFASSVTKRLEAMIQNIQAFSEGRDLLPENDSLDEFGKVDRALHLMANTIVEKARETELFIYSVSHDLRSPLLNLQGFAKELRLLHDDLKSWLGDTVPNAEDTEKCRKLLDGDIEQSLHYIESGVQRLSTIIDALLRLSRAGRVEYRSEEVMLDSVIQRIHNSLQNSVEQKNAKMILHPPFPKVWGDSAALERAIGNLMSNAIQYLSPDRSGVVEIGVERSLKSEADSQLVTIYIRDNGLGFPEGSAQRVFLPFQRFHPTNSSGEGIGLALVRTIIGKNGGKIWLSSESGAGSTFYVSLLARKPQRAPQLDIIQTDNRTTVESHDN